MNAPDFEDDVAKDYHTESTGILHHASLEGAVLPVSASPAASRSMIAAVHHASLVAESKLEAAVSSSAAADTISSAHSFSLSSDAGPEMLLTRAPGLHDDLPDLDATTSSFPDQLFTEPELQIASKSDVAFHDGALAVWCFCLWTDLTDYACAF